MTRALRVGPKSQESAYPEFDANHPSIPLVALARVTRDTLRAEAAVTSLVGKAVRGGSVFGIQKATLAAPLETAAGVMAKNSSSTKGSATSRSLQLSQPSPQMIKMSWELHRSRPDPSRLHKIILLARKAVP